MVKSESEEGMPARQPGTGGSSASKRMRDRARLVGVTIIVISAMEILTSACGSSSSSPSSSTPSPSSATSSAAAPTTGSSTGSSGGAASWVTQAKADVTQGYGTGLVKPPPTSGPKAVKGKN